MNAIFDIDDLIQHNKLDVENKYILADDLDLVDGGENDYLEPLERLFQVLFVHKSYQYLENTQKDDVIFVKRMTWWLQPSTFNLARLNNHSSILIRMKRFHIPEWLDIIAVNGTKAKKPLQPDYKKLKDELMKYYHSIDVKLLYHQQDLKNLDLFVH